MEEKDSLVDPSISLPSERWRRVFTISSLVGSIVLLICVSLLFFRYVTRPAPLPELLSPETGRNYKPHYLFSIYGVDQPVGVTLSPDGERLYVSETGGERLIKMFDRDGNPVGSFTLDNTKPGERAPVYLATDNLGTLYVSDRLQQVLIVFDRNGNYLDTMIGPDISLSEHVLELFGDAENYASIYYNIQRGEVYLLSKDGTEHKLSTEFLPSWAPLGVRFDSTGDMLVTDVSTGHHCIYHIPSQEQLSSDSQASYTATPDEFGVSGGGPGELRFPNVAVTDSDGRIFVSDGNNGRISVWDSQGNFQFVFGVGTGEGFVRLPRGLYIDKHDFLYVVDAVSHDVKVYDVSEQEPVYKFAFGDLGLGDGLFNYPNDIFVDTTGRLYIADRENDRIQVWSY